MSKGPSSLFSNNQLQEGTQMAPPPKKLALKNSKTFQLETWTHLRCTDRNLYTKASLNAALTNTRTCRQRVSPQRNENTSLSRKSENFQVLSFVSKHRRSLQRATQRAAGGKQVTTACHGQRLKHITPPWSSSFLRTPIGSRHSGIRLSFFPRQRLSSFHWSTA